MSEKQGIEAELEWLVEGGEAARPLRRWRPRGTPWAALLVIHGYAEHSGRYDRFARQLAAAGVAVAAPDLGGHGHAGGARARVSAIADLVADARAALARIRSEPGGERLFVFGHSMGGLVATALALEEQDLAGLVLSGAALADPAGLEALLAVEPFPEFRIEASQLARDPRVGEEYDRDPLNYRGPMPRETAAALAEGARAVRSAWSALELPLLVLHGGGDEIVPPSGSEELFRAARAPDKELVVLPELGHEILNEPEGEAIGERIASWLRERVEGRNAVC